MIAKLILVGGTGLGGCHWVAAPGADVPDLNGKDRLDIRYPGSDGIEEDKFLLDCENAGGTLVWTTVYDEAGEFVCEDIDF
jgi:hypothetical protein